MFSYCFKNPLAGCVDCHTGLLAKEYQITYIFPLKILFCPLQLGKFVPTLAGICLINVPGQGGRGTPKLYIMLRVLSVLWNPSHCQF